MLGRRWTLTHSAAKVRLPIAPRLVLEHLRARWYFRHATSLGRARLLGKAIVRNEGEMRIGSVGVKGRPVAPEIVCKDGARLVVGDGTFLNYGVSITAYASVEIGRNCDIGHYVFIMDNDEHDVVEHRRAGVSRPVVIEDDVWLGLRVTVLPGSRVGRGAVVGAHSVVHGDIPPNTLAVGAPARVIRSIR